MARQLRHDLRTLIGQISGYCELLLEEAEARDWQALVPNLLEIQTGCEQLVDRDVGEIGASVRGLLARADEVRAWLSASGDDASLADIDNLLYASRRLVGLVASAVGSASAEGPHTEPRALELPSGRSLTASDQPGRLLVVDDEPRNRDLLRRRLERLGCTVAMAAHGRQALEMLATGRYDVMLLDIMMPEMDGYETLRRVKAEPTLRHVPVIVLTAVDELDSAVRCIELGAEDYLAKPINPALLRARVGACLESKRLRDQEAAYLREVGRVTSAAADIEATVFDPASLGDLASRADALGQLARVVRGVAAAYDRQAQLAEENARLLGVLREQVDELERSRRLIATGEERLRQEVAELLHSRVQNRLMLAWYRLEDGRELLEAEPARAGALLEEASQQIQHIREHDVREVSHLLHPSIIQVGLVPAVERLTEDFLPQFQVDLAVDEAIAQLDDPEDNRLPEPVRLAAYRVLEEALGNAARHASASLVTVSLQLRDQQLALRVQDDGQGFDVSGVRAGLGLSSIAARVGVVGGTWGISSTPGRGSALDAFLPLASSSVDPVNHWDVARKRLS
jgi:DNA-binding response OmpR family regulator/two-component sensor histidine kinase